MTGMNEVNQGGRRALETMAARGFIFVHINKTGGSSVRQALGIEGYQHARASDLLKTVGRDRWERLTTISTIRNPWDRLVSIYHWRIKTNQTSLAELPIPFDEWLRLCLRERDPHYVKNPLMLAPQTYWLKDGAGGLLVGRLLRFEDLAADFSSLCTKVGLPQLKLPHLKKTDRKHYSYYFSKRDIELVERVYAEDIDSFGYRFEKEPA